MNEHVAVILLLSLTLVPFALLLHEMQSWQQPVGIDLRPGETPRDYCADHPHDRAACDQHDPVIRPTSDPEKGEWCRSLPLPGLRTCMLINLRADVIA